MRNAELLSFTSDYEGLGLVLVEALACETPVISTNCKTGPSEILTGELKPYLVEIENRDEDDICKDIALRMQQLTSQRLEIDPHLIAKFSRENIVQQWESA